MDSQDLMGLIDTYLLLSPLIAVPALVGVFWFTRRRDGRGPGPGG